MGESRSQTGHGKHHDKAKKPGGQQKKRKLKKRGRPGDKVRKKKGHRANSKLMRRVEIGTKAKPRSSDSKGGSKKVSCTTQLKPGTANTRNDR